MINMKTFFKTVIKTLVLSVSLFSFVFAQKQIIQDPCQPQFWQQFPTLRQHVDLSYLMRRIELIINSGKRYAGQRNLICLRWCDCKNASVDTRIILVFCQLEQILIKHPDKEQVFIHTAFAEQGLLQSYILIDCLFCLWYKNIILNVVGPEIEVDTVRFFDSCIRMNFPHISFIINQYDFAQNAIDARAKSHSFDIVDIESDLIYRFSLDEYFACDAKVRMECDCNRIVIKKASSNFDIAMTLTVKGKSVYIKCYGQKFRDEIDQFKLSVEAELEQLFECWQKEGLFHNKPKFVDSIIMDSLANIVNEFKQLIPSGLRVVIMNEAFVTTENDFEELINQTKVDKDPIIFEILGDKVMRHKDVFCPFYKY